MDKVNLDRASGREDNSGAGFRRAGTEYNISDDKLMIQIG